jgi:hypothetical protein
MGLWRILEASSRGGAWLSWGNALHKFLCLTLLSAFAGNSVLAADPLAVPADEPAPSSWSWFGDVMVREDHVTGIPRADSSLQRTFGRGRVGVLYDPVPTLEFGAAVKLAAASDDNSQDRRNNLNERSNDVAADQFFLRWHPSDNTSLLVGKSAFPLELSPLVWDQDLRPIGISAQTAFAATELDRIVLVAGYFTGNLPYGDDSRIGAVQASYRWHEGAPTSASILLSYLDFSSLQQLTLQGLARTNTHIGDRLLSDYHLLDMQMVGRFHPGGWPFEARLDLLRNLGADADRDGARLSLVLGDRQQPHGWEFGLAEQRIQRDAAMAAFNSDDWWFHSWSRGVMPWVGYGFDATWSMRLAAFHEMRDEVDRYTNRILLDVYARW